MKPKAETSRRQFLTIAGTTALGVSVSAQPVAAATPRIQGGIKLADGTPARDDTVGVTSSQERVTYVETNNGGRFRFDAPGPRELYVGYYQTTPDSNRIPSPLADGSPDIYVIANRVNVSRRPVNIGTVRLPRAYRLNVEVVDEANEPVAGAIVRVVHRRDGAGWGSGRHLTNADGLFQYADATVPGTDMVGDVDIEVSPPTGATEFEDTLYERSLSVTSPRTERFILASV